MGPFEILGLFILALWGMADAAAEKGTLYKTYDRRACVIAWICENL